MKQSRSSGQVFPVDVDLDETMAMVYVGDVYSLVAQQGADYEPAQDSAAVTERKTPVQRKKNLELNDGPDVLWPYIR